MIMDLREKILQKDKEIERLMTLTKNNSKKDDIEQPSPNRYSERQMVEKTLAEFNRELREELAEAYERQQQLEDENCSLKNQLAEMVC